MNWLYVLWFGYVRPSLKSNGPEALVQTVVYGLIALAVYPPLCHWAKRESSLVHAKLSHIIKYHPDIPEFLVAEKPDA